MADRQYSPQHIARADQAKAAVTDRATELMAVATMCQYLEVNGDTEAALDLAEELSKAVARLSQLELRLLVCWFTVQLSSRHIAEAGGVREFAEGALQRHPPGDD